MGTITDEGNYLEPSERAKFIEQDRIDEDNTFLKIMCEVAKQTDTD